MADAAVRAEAQRLRAVFEAAGAVPVEADILQPAETLLDLYGEDIRARAYVTSDPVRGELMLRPDFTVPVVQMHMANGADPARYTYAGEVFRKQEAGSARATEYLQVGYELFDGTDPARADAEVFALFAEVLAPLACGPRPATSGFSAPRSSGFRRPTRGRRRFCATSGGRGASGRCSTGSAGSAPLRRDGRRCWRRPIRWPMRGRRSGSGPWARCATGSARLKRGCGRAAHRGRGGGASRRAHGAAGRRRRTCWRGSATSRSTCPRSPAVARFEARLGALAERGVDVEVLDFEASFGRTTMEYYDGFVFGFFAPSRPDLPPVASGGRYDALTRVLGRGRSIPAVGGVIRPGLTVELGGVP